MATEESTPTHTPVVSRRHIVGIQVHNESRYKLATELKIDEETGVAHVFVRDREALIVTG
jgi:hypothetical protein